MIFSRGLGQFSKHPIRNKRATILVVGQMRRQFVSGDEVI